jgi:signal transduction histidine kinase/phage shock protein PspC (stress-responsive transcriptional regulator)
MDPDMATASRPPLAGLPAGLVRRRDGRRIGGVCAGLAGWLGVDPLVVRVAAVVLALANGVGVLVYLVLWALLPEEDAAGANDPAGVGPGEVEPATAASRRPAEVAIAVGCITLGALLLLRWTVPYFPDRLVWPAAIAGLGAGLMLARVGDADRARWREVTARLPGNPVEALRGGRGVWLRVVAGTSLLVIGIGTFLATTAAVAAVGRIGVAVLATAVGVALVFGPWIARLLQDLGAERRERIRSEERADMAAHLHDSVLQTLALIQRHADVPGETRTLARRQERELRAWLYDERRWADDGGAPSTLAAALDALADEVEADHRGVEVAVVVVGDCPLDAGVEALVKAVREAVVNAAVHSGAAEVSLYAEVAGGRVEAFVRDRGLGFDPASVNGDRRGITQSIVARMARHGGRTSLHSAPGEGTEVAIEVPTAREAAP